MVFKLRFDLAPRGIILSQRTTWFNFWNVKREWTHDITTFENTKKEKIQPSFSGDKKEGLGTVNIKNLHHILYSIWNWWPYCTLWIEEQSNRLWWWQCMYSTAVIWLVVIQCYILVFWNSYIITIHNIIFYDTIVNTQPFVTNFWRAENWKTTETS